MFKNIWRKLSSGQKITMIGSLLLILSLFLNWFSDKDVFRSGDTYTALGGPLYLPGLTMLLAAVFALGVVVLAALRNKRVMALGTATQGKMQMLAGFFSMYLLIVINSVYFHPRFGLNILEKKTEIGVTLALAATVLICVGGYLSYRRKFDEEAPAAVPAGANAESALSGAGVLAEVAPMEPVPTRTAQVGSIANPVPQRQHVPLENAPVTASAAVNGRVGAAPAAAHAAAVTPTVSPNATVGGYFSERDPRGKTEYERSKLYENLKRTMVRDTLTPEQRRKLREKEAKENAFSANFGKSGTLPGVKSEVSAAAKSGSRTVTSGTNTADTASTEKKPQMYRMDL
jgi:uncharacterized membrane protein